jgi:hypothetical protein
MTSKVMTGSLEIARGFYFSIINRLFPSHAPVMLAFLSFFQGLRSATYAKEKTMKHFKYFSQLLGCVALVVLFAACSSTPAPSVEETLEAEATSAYTLSYNKYSGEASVRVFDTTGAYTTLRNLSFSSGWTEIVKVPYGVFFYNATSGAAAFGRFSTTGSYRQLATYPAGSFWTGWTHIVNTPNGVLFYRASDGVTYLGKFDQNGNFISVNANPGVFWTGWSHIVNTPNGLFFYRASDGLTYLGKFDQMGNFITINANPGVFRAGWEQIVNTSKGILFYSSMNDVLPRLSAVGKFDGNGVYTQVNANSGAGPWQAAKIIRLSTGDLFFYGGFFNPSEVGYLRSDGSYGFRYGNLDFPGLWTRVLTIR